MSGLGASSVFLADITEGYNDNDSIIRWEILLVLCYVKDVWCVFWQIDIGGPTAKN